LVEILGPKKEQVRGGRENHIRGAS
jgi:hypothetical protein